MGFLLGLVSSAAYGLIPLFTLPLLQAGISVETTLVYRFAIAVMVMWPILAIRGERFAARGIDILKLAILSILYLFAVVLFFHAFTFLASGIVATIQFLFPVMVMVIMVCFFHERFYWHIAVAVALAVAGVAILSSGPDLQTSLGSGAEAAAQGRVFWGVLLSLLAGLCNALYFVGIQVARIPNITGIVMTFYVMLFGTVFCLANAFVFDSLQWIGGMREICIAVLLALVTAVLSNLTLILSIQRIGSTLASVLGVMEPLTAVSVGIIVFDETFSKELVAGVILIVLAVFLVMLWPRQQQAGAGSARAE